jgi:hypothetical protein
VRGGGNFTSFDDFLERIQGESLRIRLPARGNVPAEIPDHLRGAGARIFKLSAFGDFLEPLHPGDKLVAARLAVADLRQDQPWIHLDRHNLVQSDSLAGKESHTGGGNVDQVAIEDSRGITGHDHADGRSDSESRFGTVLHSIEEIGRWAPLH